MAERIITAVWFVTASVFDIKSKRLPVWLLVLGGMGAAASVTKECLTAQIDWIRLLMRCIPGIFMFLMALITDNVGTADGVALIFLGICAGVRACLAIFMTSLLLISVSSGALLMFRRVRKSTMLPYLPFLAAAWLLVSGLGRSNA